MDFFLNHWIEIVGFVGSGLTLASFAMRRMVLLRGTAIIANIVGIGYGVLADIAPHLVLHALLLPLNAFLLFQVLSQTREVRRKIEAGSASELSIDWLKPFMTRVKVRAGEVVFSRGDIASHLYYTQSGNFELVELELAVANGEIIGEIGFFADNSARTATFRANTDGVLLSLSYEQLAEAFHQNPQFGIYLMKLAHRRFSETVRKQPV